MNPRERVLAFGLILLIALAGGGFIGYTFLYVPLRDRDATIQVQSDDLIRKRERVREVMTDRPKLDRWRLLSLPADPDLALREYEKYLSALFHRSGFTPGSFSVVPKPIDAKSSPTVPGKGPVYTRLMFNVSAHGNLGSLVKALEGFYQTGLLHQVKSLSIQRPLTPGPQQQADWLDVNLTVEALSVAGTTPRPNLLPNLDPRLLALDGIAALSAGPVGLALVPWAVSPAGPLGPGVLARRASAYDAVASKNIFLGQPEAEVRQGEELDVTEMVRLTDITINSRRREAFLYDRANNRQTRLRAEAGFDSFRVMDEEGETLVRGRVVRIEPRDLVFRVDDRYYNIHVEQSLKEAMRRALTTEQLQVMGLATAENGGARGE